MDEREQDPDEFGDVVPSEAIELPSASVRRLTETYVQPRDVNGDADGKD